MAAKKSVYVEVSTSKYDVDAVMKAAVKDYKANNKTELKNIKYSLIIDNSLSFLSPKKLGIGIPFCLFNSYIP